MTGTRGPHPGPRVRNRSSLLSRMTRGEGEGEVKGVSRGFAWINYHVTLHCFLLETGSTVNLSIHSLSKWSVLYLVDEPSRDRVHLVQSIIK